jgi:hypothetical protein
MPTIASVATTFSTFPTTVDTFDTVVDGTGDENCLDADIWNKAMSALYLAQTHTQKVLRFLGVTVSPRKLTLSTTVTTTGVSNAPTATFTLTTAQLSYFGGSVWGTGTIILADAYRDDSTLGCWCDTQILSQNSVKVTFYRFNYDHASPSAVGSQLSAGTYKVRLTLFKP